MLVWEVVQTAIATILIMVIVQVVIFFVARVMTPPQPRIIYREIPAQAPPPPTVTFTEPPVTEVKLPEYEPRQQASDSLRLDAELPAGITETRPPGT